MNCKLCQDKDGQIEYLKSLINNLREENRELLNRVLLKNEVAPIEEAEIPVWERAEVKKEEGEVYGVAE